jgi:hypothetical protein
MKAENLGKVRVCPRHKKYVEECPTCNREARGEKHGDGHFVPVYRNRIKYSGKIYQKAGDINGQQE